jgi:hypothetical protein
MLFISLITHLKELGAKTAEKVVGPNGAFISYVMPDGTKGTIPVGKKSQEGKLAEYNVFVADNGQPIATVNQYKAVDSIEL